VRVRFDEIKITDFKSFDGSHSFIIDEYGRGLHFIRGRNKRYQRLGANGVGKSSIWDALCWCLYGQTPARLRNPDVEPWEAKKGVKTRVVVFVSIDGKEHKVLRGIKPNRVEIDGKTVDTDEPGRLIGMGFEVFTNAVILGQGRPLFFDLQPKDKMDLFSDALALERWEDRASFAGDRVKLLSRDVTHLEGELAGFERTVKELGALRDDTKAKRDQWDEEQQERIKDEQSRRKNLQRDLDRAEKLHGDATLKNENAEVNLRGLFADIRTAEKELSEADAELAKFEERSRSLTTQIDDARGAVKDAAKAKKCPACGTVLRKASREEHIAELAAKLKGLLDEGRVIEKQFNTALKDAEKKRKTAKRLFDTSKDYQKQADDSRSAMELQAPEIARIKAELSGSRSKTKTDEAATNPHDETLRVVGKKLKTAQTNSDNARDDIAAIERKLSRTKFWTKAFKDVRLFVLEELLQELEIVTNSMLDEAGLVNWRVSYLMEKETKRGNVSHGLSIYIASPSSKGKVKWESWSGGEAQRLRIVGALALSEVLLAHANARTNIEVLDEPTQHLSSEGVDDLIDYLSDRARSQNKSIFYVDHVAVESSKFTTTTIVERDDQGSYIKEVR
jgi:DNA repair exonuclease SbcCD ATPase subunit